jgi:integrase
MRRQRSLVTRRRKGSPTWYENYTVRGHQFRRSLGTDDRETAEILAAKNRSDALLGPLTGKQPELALTQALARYWLEHGQHVKSCGDIARIGLTLQRDTAKGGLGQKVLLSAITDADLTTYAARRRANLSNRSVNVELEHLRAVINRARDLWNVAVPKIAWKKVLLEEAGERQHVLSRDDEEERFFAALRADFHPMVRFALLTGVRLGNVVRLEWSQVDWDAATIVFRLKSKKPGGELHYVPMTPAVATILSRERGHHPTRVFTYVCARNRHDPKRHILQKKGERYPFTQDGWRRAWDEARVEAKIEDFRFHDLRHTAGTRAQRAVGNLKTVQHMLGHKDIATTLRYLRTDVADVRAAMEAVEKATLKPLAVGEEAKKESSSTG